MVKSCLPLADWVSNPLWPRSHNLEKRSQFSYQWFSWLSLISWFEWGHGFPSVSSTVKQGRVAEALNPFVSCGERWLRGGRQGDEDWEDEFRQLWADPIIRLSGLQMIWFNIWQRQSACNSCFCRTWLGGCSSYAPNLARLGRDGNQVPMGDTACTWCIAEPLASAHPLCWRLTASCVQGWTTTPRSLHRGCPVRINSTHPNIWSANDPCWLYLREQCCLSSKSASSSLKPAPWECRLRK